MSIADIVPGVSGGTLALITGIYTELISSLAAMHPRLLLVWRQQGFVAFWQAGNFPFLLTLFAGILSSIALFARLMGWLLEHYPVPRSEEHTSELQSRPHLVCRLLLEKKKKP